MSPVFSDSPPQRSVLVFSPGFPGPDDTWFAPPVSETLAALTSAMSVSVVSLYYPCIKQTYLWRGVQVTALGNHDTTRAARKAAVISAVRHALSVYPRPDLFMGVWATEPGMAAVVAGKLCRRPAVVYVAGGEVARLPHINYGDSRHWDRKWWIRRVLANADLVVAPSLWLCDRLRLERAVETSRLVLSPWGIVPRDFVGAPRNINTITLLTVAALLPVKGLELLLDAVAQVQDPRVRLLCVGDGPCRMSLAHRARRLGIGDRIEWVGLVPHNRVSDYYATADGFVHPSFWEAQGVAVLEAMAAGLPTIATNVGAAPEAIGLTGGGLVVRPDSVEELAMAIRTMVNHLETFKSLAREGREMIRSRWDVRVRAEQLADLLRNL